MVDTNKEHQSYSFSATRNPGKGVQKGTPPWAMEIYTCIVLSLYITLDNMVSYERLVYAILLYIIFDCIAFYSMM